LILSRFLQRRERQKVIGIAVSFVSHGVALQAFGSTLSPSMSAHDDTGPEVIVREHGSIRNRAILIVALLGVVAWIGLALLTDDVEEGAAILTAPGAAASDTFGGDLELSYDHNGEVVVTASLANRGRFPVTVTGAWMFPAIPMDSRDLVHLLLKQEHVLIEGASSSLPADHQINEPIDLNGGSVTILGGEELDISIDARFGNCEEYEPGTGNTFDVLRVDYRHLGIPQSVEIPVRPVVVESPAACPAR
jgi:hypothetical protein